MTVNRTTLLDLPLPVTGTESGTWGDTTNNGLTQYLDIAIAGSLVLSADSDTTLSSTEGDSSATNIGGTTAQYAVLRCTGARTTTRNINAPAWAISGGTISNYSKTYVVINDTTGGQSIVLRATNSATPTYTTGVTIVAGERAVCAWNGSDFVKVGGAAGGTNTQVQYNNNGVFGGVSGATTNGTAITFSTTNLKLQGSSTGVSSFASANSSATDYTVTFPAASTTIPVATQTLTFSGPTAARTITLPDANFTAARTDSAQTFTGVQTFSSNPVLSGGTANGVLYLNGSSVATSGSALTFDGTTFQYTGAANFATSSGNVGIGTSSPNAKLTSATGSGTTAISIIDTSLTILGTETNYLSFFGTNNTGSLITTPLAQIGAVSQNGSFQQGSLVFNTSPFNGSSTERMRLDSSGNLGLGVTPSGWGSGIKALQIGTGASLINAGASGDAYLGQNIYYNGTNNIYITTNAASQYALTSGVHKWFIAPSGTANTTITSLTQAMTLDASGRLGVGTTNPSVASGIGVVVYNSNGAARFVMRNNSTGDASTNGFQLAVSGIDAYIEQRENGFMAFATNNTERARITSGGDFFIGNGETAASPSAGILSATGGTGTNIAGANLTIRGGASTGSGAGGAIIFSTAAAGASGTTVRSASERVRITSGGYFKASNDGTYLDSIGTYHEIRQTASGNNTLQISNTTAAPYGVIIAYTGAAPNGTDNYFLYCRDSGPTLRAEIRSNGGLANYSANDVNLSDRREKTNFAPAKSYLDAICAIPVQTFNYIDQSEDDLGLTLGVVAQDVQAVAPELVMESNWGTEDNPKMRLSIYQTDLQYALMKCIQEQQALITSLTARVAALEGTQP